MRPLDSSCPSNALQGQREPLLRDKPDNSVSLWSIRELVPEVHSSHESIEKVTSAAGCRGGGGKMSHLGVGFQRNRLSDFGLTARCPSNCESC
jgi:hypothetical protein